MRKPTIVLVHGAWADGSSWNAVASELQSQGFTVLTPPNLLRRVGSTRRTLPRSSRSAPAARLSSSAIPTAVSSPPTPARVAAT